MAKKKHNEDLLKIDELITKYQAKDQKALEELLEHFDNYFNKYVSILRGGTVDLHNKDTYRFYSLFLPLQPKSIPNILMVKRFLHHLTSHLEPGDIKNELICIFIDKVLNRYTKFPGINFVNYMTQVFRFRVKDWCNDMAKNAIFVLSSIETMPDDREAGEDPVVSSGEIDLDWVASPISGIFQHLTKFQRYLLHLYYIQNLPMAKIAEIVDKDNDAICHHLQAIRNTLAELDRNE